LIDTVILSQTEIAQFNAYYGLKKRKLLYRASRDGTSAAVFHNKCNSIANTLTLIKTKNNQVFGGYASQSWSNTAGYKSDSTAYLFSLRRNTVSSVIHFDIRSRTSVYQCSPSCGYYYTYYYNYAIYNHPSYGPLFGGGHDIHIPDRFDINAGYSSAHSFYNSNYGYINSQIGSNWYVSDVEVFQITS
jgi:hypothetical protein